MMLMLVLVAEIAIDTAAIEKGCGHVGHAFAVVVDVFWAYGTDVFAAVVGVGAGDYAGWSVWLRCIVV